MATHYVEGRRRAGHENRRPVAGAALAIRQASASGPFRGSEPLAVGAERRPCTWGSDPWLWAAPEALRGPPFRLRRYLRVVYCDQCRSGDWALPQRVRAAAP